VGLCGGFLSFFFGLFFFSFSSFAFSLVYCRCTKGRLTLLIKPGYYLSKKKVGTRYLVFSHPPFLKISHWRFTPSPMWVLQIQWLIFKKGGWENTKWHFS
jgi:hypothetical protein